MGDSPSSGSPSPTQTPARPASYYDSVRSARSRRSRPSLRVPSTHSSAAFGDYGQYPSPSSRTLLSASSRYSLNDQFAATRRDYDFEDDDASSILERATQASEAGTIAEDASQVLIEIGDRPPYSEPGESEGEGEEEGFHDSGGDYYDLLCLPRDPYLLPHHIRVTYWRALLLLHEARHPEKHRALAQQYLARVQRAFETLIEPVRRAQYDRYVVGRTAPKSVTPIDAGLETSSNLTVPLDASSRTSIKGPTSPRPSRQDAAVRPLGLILGHSISALLPRPGPNFWTDCRARLVSPAQSDELPEQVPWQQETELTESDHPSWWFSHPSVTVSAAIPAIRPDARHPSSTPLPHSPQPLLPLVNPCVSPSQPLEDSPGPLIAIQLRQGILHRTADGRLAQSHLELAQELVSPTSAVRLSHPIHLKGLAEPLIIDVSAQSTCSETQSCSRIGIGLHKSVKCGVISANVDSGDSRIPADYVCDAWTGFSWMHKGSFRKLVLPSTPSFNITWTTENDDLSFDYASISFDDDRASSQHLRRVRQPIRRTDDGSWSLSAALTADSLVGALRYSHPLPRSTLSGRFEAELVSHPSLGCYFAYRSLWAVGAHSRLGFEMGVSAQAVHLSLYWSRLRHRMSLPILLSQNIAMFIPPRYLFWASVIPFVLVPGLRALAARSTARGSEPRREKTAEERQRYIVNRRAEADQVALILSGPVEVEQRRRRDKGSLVILSAKYGIKDTTRDESGAGDSWGRTIKEVADVTVAVAALVDQDDRLVIPQGVRKQGLLGFWDPAPGKVKWLHVRYSYHGREHTVEVRGRGRLVLPPPDLETL